jgi:uncharacterized protein (TIGR03437 family)
LTLFLALTPHAVDAQQNISTIAGTGAASYSGDGGPATQASVNQAVYVAVDAAGNVYVADQFNHRIRRISPGGIITTVAGTGAAAYSGDGGPATSAALNLPIGIATDAAGNLFIADTLNRRIRKVDQSGIITTVAGNGSSVYSGDGGPATSAGLNNPVRCAVDSLGNIYIADQSIHRVRKVDTSGIITTIAGTGTMGFSGDGGPATGAQLNNPTAVAVDAAGTVYFTDQFNNRIRRISGGTITTVAGTGVRGFSGDGGPATAAALNLPGGLVIDQTGEIFFADDENFRIRRINRNGVISTVAGTGVRGFSGDGGPATGAQINGQFGVAIDAAGNLIFADTLNNRIRLVSAVGAPIPPEFTGQSLTNAASFITGLTPGGLATAFGRHITVNVVGSLAAASLPLPTVLGGVSVRINGTPAPIVSVLNFGGTEQVSFQVPFSLSGAAAAVEINNGRTVSSMIATQAIAALPGVFVFGGDNAIAVHGANNALITDASPAAGGETIVVYVTGLGAVNPSVTTGAATPSDQLYPAAVEPVVTIGGATARVMFAGLTPGFAGLYQINVVVPQGVSGRADLIVRSGSVSSRPAKLAVQ